VHLFCGQPLHFTCWLTCGSIHSFLPMKVMHLYNLQLFIHLNNSLLQEHTRQEAKYTPLVIQHPTHLRQFLRLHF